MSSTFKSIRLSGAIRTNICASMLAAWEKNNVSPRNPKEIEHQVATELWLNSHANIKIALKKIPEQMLRWSEHVKVQVSGVVKCYDLPEKRPYPWRDQYNSSILAILDQPTDLMDLLENARTAKEDWDKLRSDFREEIKTILDSVQTTGQLIQLWPEAEQYLPPFAADPSKGINLPALKTSRLNSLLGIK